MNYYNENNPFVCEWLMNLEHANEIPRGYVDPRSIADVQPDELKGYTQCHFFSGILGWPLALRLAGWSDDVPVWSGSCPCPPFSSAGSSPSIDKRCPYCGGRWGFYPNSESVIRWFGCAGCGWFDERHLWPEFFRLIRECQPSIVFGEQIASKAGRAWLAGVRADLETLGYAVGAADLCAAGTGSPHIRQRLFWVADTMQRSGEQSRGYSTERRRANNPEQVGLGCESNGVADMHADGCAAGRASDSQVGCVESERGHPIDVIHCRDGKTRRISSQPSDEPLAANIPRKLGPPLTGMGQVGIRAARANHSGRLRAYGNAIVPTLAAEFIKAYLDIQRKENQC